MSNILIVDDSEDVGAVLSNLLKRVGHNTTLASNGIEALKKLEEGNYNLIISDILMPEMDGFRLCREIKENPDFQTIPFVFYTATYKEGSDEELAMELGADFFLRKPMDPVVFINTIDEIIKSYKSEKTVERKKIKQQETEVLKHYSERLVKKLEKKHLELEQAEKNYRRLYDNVNDLVFAIDAEGHFTMLNDRISDYGYHKSEIIGEKYIYLFSPARRDKMSKSFKLIERGVKAKDIFEAEIIRKDGSTAYIELSVSSIVEDAKFHGILGVARDLSDRKQAVRQILWQQSVLEGINEVLRVSIQSRTDVEVAKICLSAAEKLTGSAIGFIGELDDAGKLNTTAMSASGWDNCRIPKTEACRLIYGMEVRGIWGDVIKKEKSLLINSPDDYANRTGLPENHPDIDCFLGVPLKHADKVIGLIALANKKDGYKEWDCDAVEMLSVAFVEALVRKRAEIALQYSEKSFQDLISNLIDGIGIADLDENFIYVNPAMEKIFGDPEGGLIGRNFKEFLSNDEYDKLKKFTEKRKLGEGDTYELEIILQNGEKRQLLVSASPKYNADGIIVGSQGIFHDLTDFNKLEAQFLQAQKMEAVGRLAGGVAHDFNNLLTVISGYSNFALMAVPDDSPVAKDLKQIQKAAWKASDLTNQLLAFSRKQTVELKLRDLNEIIKDTLKMLRRVIGENIELKTDLTEPLPKVNIDLTQIEQVMINMAVNASDAMSKEGCLILETEAVNLDEDSFQSDTAIKPGKYIRFTVKDTGCGMSPKVASQIFEPFFTTKEKGKGTGLGLSTVYGIIKKHDGHITIESTLGKGSVFNIYLPASEEEKTEIIEDKIEFEENIGGKTILIVEDEDDVRMLAERMLDNMGYNVITADSGEKALKIIEDEKNKVNLILTDVVMPEMSGDELVQHVQEMNKNIKVLYMTGYTAEILAKYNIGEESVEVLRKPFTAGDLAAAVRRALSG